MSSSCTTNHGEDTNDEEEERGKMEWIAMREAIYLRKDSWLGVLARVSSVT